MNKVFTKCLLSLLIVTGILGFNIGDAWANDTRNRELNYTAILGHKLEYTHCFTHPQGYGDLTENYSINFTTDKNTLKITTESISLGRMLPENSSGICPLWFTAIKGTGYPTTPINMTYIPSYIKVGDKQYIDTISFEGKATGIITGIYGSISEFTPNTRYTISTIQCSSTENIPNLGGSCRSVYYDKLCSEEVEFYDEVNNVTSLWGLRNNFVFYTAADDPSIIVTNITTDTATISWDTNNTNPGSTAYPTPTSYTLQYQSLKENGDPQVESDWNNWTVIPVDGNNTTTKLTTIASMFEQDRTYRLRVQVNHIAGESYNVYSDYATFTTSSDPAVRAAQEAAIASQAAKKAAEDTLQYSSEAKLAAQNAEAKAGEAVNLIKNLKTEISEMFKPTIRTVKGQNGATATTGNNFNVIVSANNADYYRAGVNGVYTDWQTTPIVTVPLSGRGIKNIEVQVRKGDVGDNIATDCFIIFKL